MAISQYQWETIDKLDNFKRPSDGIYISHCKLDFLWVNGCTLYHPVNNEQVDDWLWKEKLKNIHQQSANYLNDFSQLLLQSHVRWSPCEYTNYFIFLSSSCLPRLMWKNNFHISLASHHWLNEREIYLFASTSLHDDDVLIKWVREENKLSVNDQCWLDNDL